MARALLPTLAIALLCSLLVLDGALAVPRSGGGHNSTAVSLGRGRLAKHRKEYRDPRRIRSMLSQNWPRLHRKRRSRATQCSVLHSGSPHCDRRPHNLPKWCVTPMESLHGSNVFRAARSKILGLDPTAQANPKRKVSLRSGDGFVAELSDVDIKELQPLEHYTINWRNEKVVRRLRHGVDYGSLPPDDIPNLKNRFDLSRCIVVGSSETLKGSGFGKIIDSHTAIFRFNEAPTVGYEADVGSRTTFRIQNPSRAGAAEKDEWCLVKGYGPKTYPEVEDYARDARNLWPGLLGWLNKKLFKLYRWFSVSSWFKVSNPDCHGRLNDFNQYMIRHNGWRNCKNMVALSPQFVQYTKVYWMLVPQPNVTDKSIPPPKMSSGFQGIVLALSLCKSVFIVGFSQGSGYYFDKCPKTGVEFSERHPWNLEHQCLEILKERSIVNVL